MTTKAPDVAICIHKETMKIEKGLEIGTCIYCGQRREYSGKVPKVLDRGYLNGVITAISPPGQPAPDTEVERPAEEIETETIGAAAPKVTYRKRMTPKQLEQNKEAIIKDYYTLPLRKFFEKWHMSSKRWMRLKTEWNIEPKGQSRRASAQKPSKSAKATELPGFPEFRDEWISDVQVEWFRTYKELRIAGVK